MGSTLHCNTTSEEMQLLCYDRRIPANQCRFIMSVHCNLWVINKTVFQHTATVIEHILY